MSPKRICFIEHDSKTGRISKASAQKVWTHVSQKSWQTQSTELRIKLWQPRYKNLPDPYEDISATASKVEADRAKTWEALARTYMSKMCLRRIESPTDIHALETILAFQHQHLPGFLPWRVEDEDTSNVAWVARLESASISCQIERAFDNGITMLCKGDVSRAFMTFEWAFSRICNIVDRPWFVYDVALLRILFQAHFNNLQDLSQLIITYLERLARTKLFAGHYLLIYLQNLRHLPYTSEAYAALWTAQSAQCASIYEEKIEILVGQEIHTFAEAILVLGLKFELPKAEAIYQDLVVRTTGKLSHWRNRLQFLSIEMARLCMLHQRYDKAELVVSDAFDHLLEFAREGWIACSPPQAPLSGVMLVTRLILLGQALAGQDQHERADKIFRAAIFLSSHLFHITEDTVAVDALEKYASYLRSRDRLPEAEIITQKLNEALRPFNNTLNQNLEDMRIASDQGCLNRKVKLPVPIQIVESFM